MSAIAAISNDDLREEVRQRERELEASIEDDETTTLLGQDTVKETPVGYRRDVLIILGSLLALIAVATYITVPPMNKIIEQNICRDYFPEAFDGSRTTSGDPCKSPPVQGRLATIRGWQISFDCMPTLLTSIIYGIASDRYGRKPVQLLSMVGITIAQLWITLVLLLPDVFSVEWSWFSSAFTLIGGGGTVFVNGIYTIAADVVPINRRTTLFFRLGSIVMVGELFASPIGGLMSDYNPWVPYLIGVGCLALCNVVILALPETLDLRESAIAERRDEHDGRGTTIVAPDSEDEAEPNLQKESLMREAMQLMAKDIKNSWAFLFSNTHLLLLLLALVTSVLGRYAQELLLQYATKRYNWTWGRAAFILTVKSVSQVVYLLGVLPALGAFLVARYHMTPARKDMWLSRIGVIGAVVGSLGIAFAVTPPLLVAALIIFGIGAGFSYSLRSLLNSLVEAHFVGTLNATIGLCEDIGMIIAAPILFGSLKTGLELGGLLIGLPFIVAAALLFNSAVIIWAYRLRPSESH